MTDNQQWIDVYRRIAGIEKCLGIDAFQNRECDDNSEWKCMTCNQTLVHKPAPELKCDNPYHNEFARCGREPSSEVEEKIKAILMQVGNYGEMDIKLRELVRLVREGK
jgi:hypothetical protein